MKWITTLTLMALLPLTSSALLVTRSYSNLTSDNDSTTLGDANSITATIGDGFGTITTVGSSTAASGARFQGANSGRGVNAGGREFQSIAQAIDVSVTWTIEAESWEEYSINLTPEFHGYLNVEDGAGDEPGDMSSFSSFITLLTVNGSSLVDTLDLSGGSRNTAGSSNIDDTASQIISGLSGNNTIVLRYNGTSTARWDTGAGFQNNRTAIATLWGMDGTMNGDVSFTDGFDNYGSSSARNADGLFVDAVVTLDAIPEPATLGLIGLFGGGILAIRRFFLI